jgi:predicted nucleic acid-binding protein
MLERAGAVLEAIALRPLDRALLAAAGAHAEPALRALDAIHVASAIDLHHVDTFVTYEERRGAAARLAGLRTMAPGA